MTDTAGVPRVIARTVAEVPSAAAERYADRLLARYMVDGEWREMSYAEAVKAINEIALGLVDLGIEVGDRVAILSDTRVEWTLASYGIAAAGAVVVPIYPTNAPKECEWVAGNSGARAVICETQAQAAKIDEVRSALPDLETVIVIEPGVGELTLDELRARGRGGDVG